jgi:hypothetical protein
MINEANIRKLIDYTLLNACSINSSGLYNGKAGIALALFEAARYLQDEYIEEQAFDLLQEALVNKTEDISFESGLSGIGYVLLYLIENEFIEADFDELFEEQLEKILAGFEKLKENPDVLLNSIRMSYFLTSVQSFHKVNNRMDKSIKSIFEANELYLAIQFFDFKDIDYINNKSTVLERLEIYLQMVHKCRYADYSRVVLDDYAELYRSGRIMSSSKVAYYLGKIDTEGKYKDVIEGNRWYSDFNNVQTLTLRDRIDLSHLSGDTKALQEIISVENVGNLQKVILQTIPKPALVAGYEQGISRLLIYLTSNKSILF